MTTKDASRILLVDDDPIVLESLADLLAEEGWGVSMASDVTCAVNSLAGGAYALVMTDVSMPTCDGFELLRHVRQKHPAVVVILMTGYGMIESAVEGMKQGAYSYLTKPIIDDEVRATVRRGMERRELLAENQRLKDTLSQGDREGAYVSCGRPSAERDSEQATLHDSVPAVWAGRTLAEALAEPEKQIIQAALRCHGGSRQKAAAQLGINRTTLYKKMKRHGLLDGRYAVQT